jgi:hypothetical protein
MNKEPYRTDQAALNQIVRVTRSLLAFGSSGVESISGGPPIDRQQLTKALEEHIQSQPTIPTTPTPDVTAKLAAAEALSKADAALARTANGGSAGSPVFEADDWRVVAVHHASSPSMTRFGSKGTYEANEGISILAVQAAIRKLL